MTGYRKSKSRHKPRDTEKSHKQRRITRQRNSGEKFDPRKQERDGGR